MFRTIPLLTLCVFLAGCATGSSDSGDSPGSGNLTVLNYLETAQPRSAYLAKFEVVAGSAALLFPTRERDIEPTGPGTHRLRGILPTFVKAQRDLYGPRATGLLNRPANSIVNVTILVITSDQPLNLEPFLSSASGLRSHLLAAGATTENLVLAEIMRTVVPNPELEAWASDIRSVRIADSWSMGR